MSENQPMESELQQAEETLKSTLAEACAADVVHADTGELIKVEEMLAIASDAAKRAISIRRKRRHSGAVSTGATREFTDEHGIAWTVRAVHPADRSDARHQRLLGTFQQGWLAFECVVPAEGHGKRRLSPIPAEWESLDAAGLQQLFLRAEEPPAKR